MKPIILIVALLIAMPTMAQESSVICGKDWVTFTASLLHVFENKPIQNEAQPMTIWKRVIQRMYLYPERHVGHVILSNVLGAEAGTHSARVSAGDYWRIVEYLD